MNNKINLQYQNNYASKINSSSNGKYIPSKEGILDSIE